MTSRKRLIIIYTEILLNFIDYSIITYLFRAFKISNTKENNKILNYIELEMFDFKYALQQYLH